MKIESIIEKIDDLPTLPTIYSSLIDILANPRSSVHDVSNVIAQDQSSSVKILKAVNSSVFGLRTRVSSISQAVFHLGFNEVKNIIITLSLIKLFEKSKSCNSFNIVDFWKHSIAVGVITRLLGKTIGVQQLEDYFVSGIIHDIGKLFMLTYFFDQYSKTIDSVFEQNILLRHAELNNHGVTHNTTGELLAIKWKLPDNIKNAIKHHNIGNIGGRVDRLVACVHIADIIARTMKLGNPGDNLIPQPYFEAWDALNISPGTLVSLMPRILNDYSQSASILIIN